MGQSRGLGSDGGGVVLPRQYPLVNALAVSGSTVYVGGTFTSVGGQTRSRIATLDAASGLALDWNPDASSSSVATLAVGGGMVYAGGRFPGMGGLPYSYLAAIVAPPPSGVVTVEGTPAAPDRLVLAQCYPNPARGRATIRFGLPRPGAVSLRVYDVAGRVVRVLVDGERPAGWHSVPWNRADGRGGRLAAGIYFYELRTPGTRLIRRLVALE